MPNRGLTLIFLLLGAQCAFGEALYRLPWPEGRTFIFGQAPGGMITTHFTQDSRYAIDIPMPEGTPVLAARGGVVESAEGGHGSGAPDDPLTVGGNFVRVRHEDGTVATYAHFKHQGVAVEAGRKVDAGELLGYSGTTGFSSGPHLHFGVARMTQEKGGLQEISVPVTFYVGDPPRPLAARASLVVTADYSARAERPRPPREAKRLVEWKPRVLSPEELARAWEELAVWLLAGLAGLAWFWKFSIS